MKINFIWKSCIEKIARISLNYFLKGAGEGSSSSTSPPSEVFHGFTQPAQLDNLLLSTQGG